MRNISTIYPAIAENKECPIAKALTLFIDFEVGVSLDHGVSLLYFVLLALQTFWATFQPKNNARSALLALHLP